MSSIIVLGGGMVGSAMAADLSAKHKVTLADFDLSALERAKSKYKIEELIQLNVTDVPLLKKTVEPFELVVCAVPGFLGFGVLKTLIEMGKKVVDISFFPENSLELKEIAIQNQSTAIVDCGVAPGMGNLILAHHNSQMKITDFECLVGGLPKLRKWPFEYKAPFSPMDVIEEYTRPARYVENGNLLTKEALSDCELIEFEGVGTLEAFNTDGLRSLIFTLPHIPNMKEKTLRYPGHVDYIKALKTVGFFDETPVEIDGKSIRPLDFTSRMLFKEWKLADDEAEFTVMRIGIKGKNDAGEIETVVYDLYDEYDAVTGVSSMARTTGYTATAVVNWLLESGFNEVGVFPPELIGHKSACFDFVMNYLNQRGVRYRISRF